MASILFETSGFLAVPRQQVAALRTRGHSLYLSPLAIWEVLTHLDERGRWDRFKGLLLKARPFNFLDDPIATLHQAVGPAPPPDRTPDFVLLRAVLDRLATAESLNEFYATPLALPNGTHRHVAGCSERARNVLDEGAQRFTELVRSVGRYMVSQYGAQPSPDDIVVAAVSLARGDLVRAEARGEIVRIEDAANASLMFWIYVVQQAIRYAVAGSGPARNDYEDAQILFHLRLREQRVVVTQDKRLSEVLRSAESLLGTLDDADITKKTMIATVETLEGALTDLSS